MIALSLCAVAPWRLVDTDALSRIAVGRYIVSNGHVPETDPFTFSRPRQRWSNPEWGGDVLWYGAFRLAGEPGVLVLRWLLVVLGWSLAYAVAKRRGASTVLVVSLLLCTLPAVAPRLHVRNEVHAQWLVPLFVLLLQRDPDWKRTAVVGILSVFWANLHSSFVLGWALIGAALAREAVAGARGSKLLPLSTLLLAQPVLAMVGPQGYHVYAQLLDHWQNAGMYRQLLLEWRPLEQTSAELSQLPVHLVGIIGLLSFLPKTNRRNVEGLLHLGLALALAHTSQRFAALFGVLAVPVVVLNIQHWLDAKASAPRTHALRLAQAVTTAVGVVLAAAAVWTARTQPQPAVFDRPDSALRAASFIAQHVPAGTRLFNPYNAGPFLLWAAGPRVPIYIDPRNNLGAPLLQQYVNVVLVDPAAFEQQVKRQRIDLALADLGDGRMTTLLRHLRGATQWHLTYLDGRFALFARRTPRASALLEKAYRVVDATLGFDYLNDRMQQLDKAERTRLRQQAPALSLALDAYLSLVTDTGPPPLLTPPAQKRAVVRAQQLLAKALPQLPASAALMSYLATAYGRLGQTSACMDVLALMRKLFPDDPHTLFLRLEISRRAGDQAGTRDLARRIRRLGLEQHPLARLLGL